MAPETKQKMIHGNFGSAMIDQIDGIHIGRMQTWYIGAFLHGRDHNKNRDWVSIDNDLTEVEAKKRLAAYQKALGRE